MTEVKNCIIQPKKNIYKPLFHQIFKTSKQREHAIQRVLRKYYKLKTYSKPLHLILTSNFPYILNITINQSTGSGIETVQMKGRAKSLPVIRRKSRRKVWFVAYVRNPTQCSRVNLGFNKSLSSSRCKPEKTTRKTRVRIRGVFGRVEKRFPGTEKFTRKEPRKVFGPEKFSGLLRNARQGSNPDHSIQSWVH